MTTPPTRIGVLGADEAGKGPVIGPMVAAAVRADPADLPDGVADSKRLTAERRETLARRLRDDDRIEIAVAVVGVDRIDHPETDMNGLTVAAQAEALAPLARADDATIVDAGDVDEARFGRRVRERVADLAAERESPPTEAETPDVPLDVTAEHGADDAYPVVAAASVVAKVERDHRVATVADDYPSYEVGSGYPSDETTRDFLRAFVGDTGELPDCARASWSTATDVLAAAEQSGLDEF